MGREKSRLAGAKRWAIGIGAVCALTAATAVTLAVHARTARAERAEALARVHSLLEGDDADGALAVLREFDGSVPRHSAEGYKWRAARIDALTRAKRVPELVDAFGDEPDVFTNHEEASLLVARAFVTTDSASRLRSIRDAWRGRETMHSAWLALDSDWLARDGRPEEARELLESTRLDGRDDAARSLRLALLSLPNDPTRAWNDLGNAFSADSTNADVRSFRGQMLEAVGDRARARIEYVAALLAAPDNPLHRDRLAEFYRRGGQIRTALDTWRDGLHEGAPDFVWLKVAFWSRVAHPNLESFDPPPLDDEKLGPTARFIARLPPGTFWDAKRFDSVPESSSVISERQELYWLQVLQALADGDEERAVEVMRVGQFRAQSFDPVLEEVLVRVLSRRRHGISSSFVGSRPRNPLVTETGHRFLREVLETARASDLGVRTSELDPQTARVIDGDFAFVATFLAAGWIEAALTLEAGRPLPADAPVWFTYGLAQARRLVRTPREALEFLDDHGDSPECRLLQAELHIAVDEVEVGLDLLETLARSDSDVGYRAAWLLAIATLERGKPEAVPDIVASQPRLASQPVGKELLARAELLCGNDARAETIYASIDRKSIEAGAFLARRAFARSDWKQARKITLKLLSSYPDEVQLLAILEEIARREQQEAKR